MKTFNLTPRRRLKIYEYTLEHFDEQYAGFCRRFTDAICDLFPVLTLDYVEHLTYGLPYNDIKGNQLQGFVEIIEHMPDDVDRILQKWWNYENTGQIKRKGILECAIANLKKDIEDENI